MKKLLLVLLLIPSFLRAMQDEPVMITGAAISPVNLTKFPEELKERLSKLMWNEFLNHPRGRTVDRIFGIIPGLQYSFSDYAPYYKQEKLGGTSAVVILERDFLEPQAVFFIGRLINQALERYNQITKLNTKEEMEDFLKDKSNPVKQDYSSPSIAYNIKNLSESREGQPSRAGYYIIDYFTDYYTKVLHALSDYDVKRGSDKFIEIKPTGHERKRMPFEMPPLPYFDYSKLEQF